MAINIKPMTKSELRKYVAAYRPLFRDWTKVREGFVRISGPVAQQVWFENLRSGAYRPATAVSILVAKDGGMMHQFLDIRNREVLPREHNAVFENVCEAITEQFVPPIAAPLEANETCRLCEEEATDRVNHAHSLSAFNAYLGNIERAKHWIEVVKQLTHRRVDLPQWEIDCVNAARNLEEAIACGNAKPFLDKIRQSEESRILPRR